MATLAIDCALSQCAVAVTGVPVRAAARTLCQSKGHAEALLPLIDAVLEDAKAEYGDLSRICVTVGPGSFTGVRVGLACARGLGLALGVPVFGITTLMACGLAGAAARGLAVGDELTVTLDARRGEVYGQSFAVHDDGSGLRSLAPPFLAPQETLAQKVRGALVSETAVAITMLANMVGGLPLEAADDYPPTPLYIRPPDAKLPPLPEPI